MSKGCAELCNCSDFLGSVVSWNSGLPGSSKSVRITPRQMLMPECGILTKVTEPPTSFSIRGRFSGWTESCTTWITPCYWSSLKGGCVVFTWQIFRNLPIFFTLSVKSETICVGTRISCRSESEITKVEKIVSNIISEIHFFMKLQLTFSH